MASPEEVRRLLSDVTAVKPYTGGIVNLNQQQGEEPVYVGYGLYFVPPTQSYVKQGINDIGEAAWLPATPAEITALEKAMATGSDGGGGGGGAAEDPLVAQLRQQQLLSAQGQEARAQEMQPYDIANIQSTIEARSGEQAYNEANLARQTLQDQFTRATDAFESARLAESLALEKKKTAASLLTSLVDNLVPAGMTSLPGIPGSTMPTVGTVDWSQITTGLNPQTDQALQYLMQFQQQNAGV
jgi:hypothetical protein